MEIDDSKRDEKRFFLHSAWDETTRKFIMVFSVYYTNYYIYDSINSRELREKTKAEG